jgi:hypothetical protein
MISDSKKDVEEKLQHVPVLPCDITGVQLISLTV